MVHRETVANNPITTTAIASITYNNILNIIPRKYIQKKYIIIAERLYLFFEIRGFRLLLTAIKTTHVMQEIQKARCAPSYFN
jgi:hypothetical protein